MEIRFDGVDVFNPIEGKMDVIIDSLVEFYGEKNRSRIEERFKNTAFIFVPQTGFSKLFPSIKSFYSQCREDVVEEIFAEFTSDEKRLKSIQTISLQDIVYCREDFNAGDPKALRVINEIFRFLKIFKTTDDKLAEIGIFEDRQDKEALDRYYKTLARYPSDNKNFDEMKEFLLSPENNKILEDFINRILELYKEKDCENRINKLNDEEQKNKQEVIEFDKKISEINKKFNKEKEDFINSYMTEILGEEYVSSKGYFARSCFEEFLTMDFSDITSLDMLSDYFKQIYVEFFKQMGFDYGDNLEDYINKEEILKIANNQQAKEKLEELEIKKFKTLVQNYDIFNDAVEKIKSLDIAGGDFYAVESLYYFMKNNDAGGAYAQSFMGKDGTIKSVVVCPWAISCRDNVIIHELGHITTTIFLENKGNVEAFLYGFDHVEMKLNNIDYNGDNFDLISHKKVFQKEKLYREFEAEDEIINDYFMLEVCKILHSKGIKLNLGKQEDKTTSRYSNAFQLMKPFIEKFKQELIDCLCDNPNNFQNIIGKDNFDRIANICTKYLSLAPDLNYKFNKQVKEIMSSSKEDLSFADAVLSKHDWEEELQPFVDQFAELEDVLKNIKHSVTI